MDGTLFSIQKLVCSYDRLPASKVLVIEELQIPAGKLIFLLGASGCGKSTLLETLGLMNNTVASGNIFLHPSNKSKKISIPELWQLENEPLLTEVRKKYYSFIFQNTNLMENFTAYENVCLSGMIKEGVVQELVLPDAKQLMEKIKLPESEVNLNTLAVNLSGGQRQRLAFVRALNNKATILFGDEPTGNLDEAMASELFEIIKSNLTGGHSAIVVSHDINLAVKYADQIIVITKEAGRSYGEVKKENIFDRKGWRNYSTAEVSSFKARLGKFYNVDSESIISKETSSAATNVLVGYHQLFLKKEGAALAGKNLSNFLVLSLILLFTFLAIGFANGSLDYLKRQLSDPFVNWIPVTIPYAQSSGGKIDRLLEDLNSPVNKIRFHLKQSTPYVRHPLRVLDPVTGKFNYAISRSVNVDEDAELLSGFILDKGNVINGKIRSGFKNENDIGVIVTRNFLAENRYPPDANFIYCRTGVIDTINNITKDIPVQVPVRAIVKRLPGKYGLVYPLFLFQTLMYDKDNTFDSTTKTNNYFIFFETDDLKEAGKFKSSLERFLKKSVLYNRYSPGSVYQSVDTVGWKAGFRYEVNFDSSITSLEILNGLIGSIKVYSLGKFDRSKISRVYDYSGVSEYEKDPKFDDISVYFEKLDSVSAFARYMYEKADAKNNADIIQVDDAKVKEKENYLFLSNVTKIISLLLVIFSTLAVCLFIINLLKSHLSKVKMNIGTFKAIGLTDKESRDIYFKIILVFIAFATLISFISSTIIGFIINLFLSNNADKNIRYFKMLDFSDVDSVINLITFATVLVIFISTIIMSKLTIVKILSKTPGDLIYNR
ncbi:MAG: macrolide transporter permease/ATP-binding protein MacB [Ferruginibacter sp.]|nr:macrolide transporter permease/ATP-binding protein MacB [Ferruginibacter sp.]